MNAMTSPKHTTLMLDLNDSALLRALLLRERELGPLDASYEETVYTQRVDDLLARVHSPTSA